jgi:hypothetical protein
LSLGIHVAVSDRPKTRSAVVPLVRNTLLDGNIPPNSPSIPPVSSVVAWSAQRQALVLEHLDEEITTGFASPGLYWGHSKVLLRPPTP